MTNMCVFFLHLSAWWAVESKCKRQTDELRLGGGVRRCCADGFARRRCAVDSVMIPGSEKFTIVRYGNNHVHGGAVYPPHSLFFFDASDALMGGIWSIATRLKVCGFKRKDGFPKCLPFYR